MAATSYLLGLGSNRAHPRHGAPADVLSAAAAALAMAGVRIERLSPVMRTRAMGPGGRDYANAVALVATPLDPAALLALAKRIERDFGRRPGRRWGARVLDLDILAWGGGRWRTRTLTVPHPHLAMRAFALAPAAAIAPRWRVPTRAGPIPLAALEARRRRPRPVDRPRACP